MNTAMTMETVEWARGSLSIWVVAFNEMLMHNLVQYEPTERAQYGFTYTWKPSNFFFMCHWAAFLDMNEADIVSSSFNKSMNLPGWRIETRRQFSNWDRKHRRSWQIQEIQEITDYKKTKHNGAVSSEWGSDFGHKHKLKCTGGIIGYIHIVGYWENNWKGGKAQKDRK